MQPIRTVFSVSLWCLHQQKVTNSLRVESKFQSWSVARVHKGQHERLEWMNRQGDTFQYCKKPNNYNPTHLFTRTLRQMHWWCFFLLSLVPNTGTAVVGKPNALMKVPTAFTGSPLHLQVGYPEPRYFHCSIARNQRTGNTISIIWPQSVVQILNQSFCNSCQAWKIILGLKGASEESKIGKNNHGNFPQPNIDGTHNPDSEIALNASLSVFLIQYMKWIQLEWNSQSD